MSHPSNMLVAFLTGTLLGSAMGLLFYTSKGKGVRRGIVRKSEALADTLNEKIQEGKALLTDLQRKTNSAKNKVSRVMEVK